MMDPLLHNAGLADKWQNEQVSGPYRHLELGPRGMQRSSVPAGRLAVFASSAGRGFHKVGKSGLKRGLGGVEEAYVQE